MNKSSIAILCATGLTIVLVIMIMVSDLFIRPENIPGADPDEWDTVGSIAIGLTGGLIVLEWIRSD